ncbi:MAG: hypothetical protein ACK46Y_02985 [Fluviicola sp.]
MNKLEVIQKASENENQDSLIICNEILQNYLMEISIDKPELISYDFPKIPSYQSFCVTSPDRKLRIYSWDTYTGGSMRFFSNVVVWKENDSLYTKMIETLEGEPGGFYSQIFQVTDELNTFYILNFNSILSSKDCYQAFQTVDLDNSKINFDHKKIKTKSGLTSKVGFSYDFYSVIDREERPVKLIEYDNQLRIIRFPIVNSKGFVTSKKISYQYDGKYFLRIHF